MSRVIALATIAVALIVGVAWGTDIPRCTDGETLPCFDPYDDEDGSFMIGPLGVVYHLRAVDQLQNLEPPGRGGVTVYPDGFAVVCPKDPYQPCVVGVVKVGRDAYGRPSVAGTPSGFLWPIIVSPPKEPPKGD